MLPNSTVNILKNGMGVSQPAAKAVLCIGPGKDTPTGIMSVVGSSDKAISLYGYSPLGELSAYIAKYAGSCYAYDVPATYTHSDVAMTKTGTGSGSITIDGYATNDFKIIVNILDGYTYTFSLDNGLTTSKVRKIVSNTTYELPGAGLSITFGISTGYVSGDVYTFNAVGPKMDASDLDLAFNALKNSETIFSYVVVYDGKRTAANSKLLFVALDAELDNCEALQEPLMGIIGFGELSTTQECQTAMSEVESNRICKCPATVYAYSALSREGFSGLQESGLLPFASRLARCMISEDPGQVDRGPIDGIIAVDNDEAINPIFDDYRAVSFRKYRGKTGYFVTNSWMSGSPGEDVEFVQHRRVMDVAVRIVNTTSTNWIKRPTRVKSDGTINEDDALKYESQMGNTLDNLLKKVTNSAGTKGHISDYRYVIDRTVNLLQTKTIYATLSIQPLGYPSWITTTVSFVATLA